MWGSASAFWFLPLSGNISVWNQTNLTNVFPSGAIVKSMQPKNSRFLRGAWDFGFRVQISVISQQSMGKYKFGRIKKHVKASLLQESFRGRVLSLEPASEQEILILVEKKDIIEQRDKYGQCYGFVSSFWFTVWFRLLPAWYVTFISKVHSYL